MTLQEPLSEVALREVARLSHTSFRTQAAVPHLTEILRLSQGTVTPANRASQSVRFEPWTRLWELSGGMLSRWRSRKSKESNPSWTEMANGSRLRDSRWAGHSMKAQSKSLFSVF